VLAGLIDGAALAMLSVFPFLVPHRECGCEERSTRRPLRPELLRVETVTRLAR